MNKRIEEVAGLVSYRIFGLLLTPTETHNSIANVLQSLPEFQTPPRQWVQCSERMPPKGMPVILKHNNWDYTATPSFDDKLGTSAQAWMEIPPYVAPESELVRRCREKARTWFGAEAAKTAIQMVQEIEKELAAGKGQK